MYLRSVSKELTNFTAAMRGCHIYLSSLLVSAPMENENNEGDYKCKGPVKLGCGHVMSTVCAVQVSYQ